MKKNGSLVIRGAREHNLRNINLELPRNKMVVITGLSGSGKSSLAFDTIYAEGRRRYVESLSAYARQFLGQMEKPDVDRIEGLSPAISIDQKTGTHNPRSTVGTLTEVYDYLRLLFARAGAPHCFKCGRAIAQQSISQISDRIMTGHPGEKIAILSPVVRGRKGEHKKILEKIEKGGFVRVRVDGGIYELERVPALAKQKKHDIEIVVDRLQVSPNNSKRIADSLETASNYSGGLVLVQASGGKEVIYSRSFACPYCSVSLGELAPRLFSFNSPYGACRECGGLGTKLDFNMELVIPDRGLSLNAGAVAPLGSLKGEWGRAQIEALSKIYGFSLDDPFNDLKKRAVNAILYGHDKEITVRYEFDKSKGEYKSEYEGLIPWMRRRYKQTTSEKVRKWIESYMSSERCSGCGGARLKPEGLAVLLSGMNIAYLCSLSIKLLRRRLAGLQLEGNRKIIGRPILKEISDRLAFMEDVGLGYLSLDRSANTLAGGEAQRLRLATQIGSRLMGVLYILDEPSIGLHHRDNAKLIKTLHGLRDIGNTVIVIEHDRETIMAADYIIDLGPGAGLHGGDVVAAGTPAQVQQVEKSMTGRYLKQARYAQLKRKYRRGSGKLLTIRGARENNLKNIDVEIPLGLFACVTGVSGSGKSTMVNDILYRSLRRLFYRSRAFPGKHDGITGAEHIDKVIDIDQSPIGRTPRSNPATYTGLFTPIRDIFSRLPDSRMRGYKVGRFSFNVPGGRCEKCRGDGVIKVEMHFLPDIFVNCDVCKGRRYNQETLEVTFKGYNISDVLDLSVEEAQEIYANVPSVRSKCEMLSAVGLGYIKLGQQATTLSGGEAQRVKLAAELSKRSTGRTLYILDEPTTGLHHEDVKMLLDVLNKLVDKGNSVVVIEHNPDVILAADYIIDLGPEGGDEGGEMVAAGTPEDIMLCRDSHTGTMLKEIFSRKTSDEKRIKSNAS